MTHPGPRLIESSEMVSYINRPFRNDILYQQSITNKDENIVTIFNRPQLIRITMISLIQTVLK